MAGLEIPDELDHDEAFCGEMTDAGLPCQRRRNRILHGCPRHSPFNKAARAVPQIGEAYVRAIEQASERAKQAMQAHAEDD